MAYVPEGYVLRRRGSGQPSPAAAVPPRRGLLLGVTLTLLLGIAVGYLTGFAVARRDGDAVVEVTVRESGRPAPPAGSR